MDIFSFYRSKEWETLRRTIQLERGFVCEMCHKTILRPYDSVCHHVTPLTEDNVNDSTISLNPSNIQLLCHECHNRIHERFGYQPTTRHIYVVHGSPCSGRSDYAIRSAGKDDIVIDIDRIYDSLNGSRFSTKTNALDVYNLLIDNIKVRRGTWRTAWIVRSLPYRADRERISKILGGCEFIHIDSDKDECLLKAQAKGKDWLKWEQDYWDKFEEVS